MTSLCNTLQLSHRPCLRQGSDLTCPSHYTSQQGLQSSPAWSDLSSGINSYSFSLLYVLNLEVSSNWNIASRHYFFLKSKKSKREFDCNSMTIYAGEEYFNDKSFSNIRPLILFHWYRVLYIQSIKNLFFFFPVDLLADKYVCIDALIFSKAWITLTQNLWFSINC